MKMKLSSNKEYLVLDNLRLVHYLLHKMGININSQEYEDFVSIGTIGLINAAITFDESKKYAFSTYAARCIKNEIFMHYRKNNKHEKDISIDEPIKSDEEGALTIGDTLEYSESNFVEKMVNKEECIQLVSIILNYLKGKSRLAVLYTMGDVAQRDIAKKLNVSQSYISRIVRKAINRIREAVKCPVDYNKVFSMEIIGNEYRISFSSKKISNFSKIFVSHNPLTQAEKLPNLKVNCSRERILIRVPAHPESFALIAKIIQKIDDFSEVK